MADIHISSVTADTSTPASANIHISSVSVDATVATTLEPFQPVTLPVGTWTRTSGPAVTITGGRNFITPATATGGTLLLTQSGGGSLSFTVLPHTMFLAKSGAWKGVSYENPVAPPPPVSVTPAMPVGDITGYRQIIAQDFLIPVAEGGFVANTSGQLVSTGGGTAGYNAYGAGASGGAKLTMYPLSWATTGTRTTYGNGVWDEGIVSVVDSKLTIKMRTRSTAVGSFPRGAAVKPVLPSGSYNFGPYGMYQARVRTVDVNKTPSNYNVLLLAIDSNNWDGGELDWFENDASGPMSGWYHYKVPAGTRAGGNDPKIRATSPKLMSDWNIVTVKWEPGRMYWGVRGDNDEADYVALNSTTAVPTDPMAVLFQMETNSTTPDTDTVATFECDWFVAYEPSSVTPTTPVEVLPDPEFGTLQTSTTSMPTTYAAGIRHAMYEINWREWETVQGTLLASKTTEHVNNVNALIAAGFKVTLGLGLHYKPTWYNGLGFAAQHMVNHVGETATGFTNMIFSQTARNLAQSFLTRVNAVMPMSKFDTIRITSGDRGEVLYPENTGGVSQYNWWLFDDAAQGGADLATGQVSSPWPGWLPGQTKPGGATTIGPLLDFAVEALVRTVKWQEDYLTGLGFTGKFELTFPGSGVRPSVWTAMHNDANLLSNNTGAVGAVWQTIAAGVPNRSRSAIHCTSVANNTSTAWPTTADLAVGITSTAANGWTPARWCQRIAEEYGMEIRGENPGYQMGIADADYKDLTSSGLMARVFNTITQPGMVWDRFYWAHHGRLTDGTIPNGMAEYASRIAAFRATQ